MTKHRGWPQGNARMAKTDPVGHSAGDANHPKSLPENP